MRIAAEEAYGEQSLVEYLLNDPSFYASLALVTFFGLLMYMGVFKTIAKTLDDRAEGIRNELDDAKRLREEAAEMLASYQRKQREAEAEAEAIIAQAKSEAKILKEESRKELTERLERRTAMAEQRIAQAEAQAWMDFYDTDQRTIGCSFANLQLQLKNSTIVFIGPQTAELAVEIERETNNGSFSGFI